MALLTLPACQSYRLEGIVVQGDAPGVYVVNKNDPRLAAGGAGVDEAALEFTLDPKSMSPKRLATVTTDPAGAFTADVGEPGAGVLEYELGLLCRAAGFRPVWETVPLPSGGKRLLIVMTPGNDRYEAPVDILEETMRMGEEELKRR